MNKPLHLVVLALAAALEVGGDAVIRKGLRGNGLGWVGFGFVMLGLYGVAVNLVPVDFSRLLGGYVAVFALASVLFGRVFFEEQVATVTWVGLAVIGLGAILLQLGGPSSPASGP